MSSTKINGKAVAATVKEQVAKWIEKDLSHKPRLAIISIGDDDASKVYVKNKLKAAVDVGIHADQHIFTYEDYSDYNNFYKQLDEIIDSADGVILQLPVPSWCDEDSIINRIPYWKDVDGLTTMNVGKLRTYPRDAIGPCTPAGIMELLYEYGLHTKAGTRNALVVGRSHLVGRPIAEMLLQEDWTVTIAHSKTPKDELLKLFANADLVISAAGIKDLITEEDAYQFWKDNRHYFPDGFDFKRDRIIVDVSINRDENGKLCGDFSEEFKQKYSAYYTPVPGGVGPMTVAMLMFNVYMAAKDKSRKEKELME